MTLKHYIPISIHFYPFCSTANRFCVTGYFKTIARIDLKIILNIIRSKLPHPCFTNTSRARNFNLFALFIASYFQVTDNFETSALNGPKMTFYTTISKMATMWFTIYPKSQISLCFAVQPAVFETRPFSEKKTKCSKFQKSKCVFCEDNLENIPKRFEMIQMQSERVAF